MSIIARPNSSAPKGSTYNGSSYTPDTIDTFVRVTDRQTPWDAMRYPHSGTAKTMEMAMTATQALDAVDMNVEIVKSPLYLADGTELPDVVATGYHKPSDGSWMTMGYVGTEYGIIQPGQSLAFLDDVVGAKDGAHYSSVWSMRQGRQLGVTLDFPDTIVVGPGDAEDTVGTYLLAVNSFDGSSSYQVAVMATRFYCLNQLFPSLRQAARKYTFRHTKNVVSRVQQAREALDLHRGYIEALDIEANRLYQQSVTDQEFYHLIQDVLPMTDDASDRQAEARSDQWSELMGTWRADNNANITGTAWGAFNVMTEWAEWGRPVRPRNGNTSDAARATRTLSGDVSALQHRTLAALV